MMSLAFERLENHGWKRMRSDIARNFSFDLENSLRERENVGWTAYGGQIGLPGILIAIWAIQVGLLILLWLLFSIVTLYFLISNCYCTCLGDGVNHTRWSKDCEFPDKPFAPQTGCEPRAMEADDYDEEEVRKEFRELCFEIV